MVAHQESSAVSAAAFVASTVAAKGVLAKSYESDGPVANGVTIANAVANVENAFNELKKTIVNVGADSIVPVEGKNNKSEKVDEEKESETEKAENGKENDAETMEDDEDYEEEEEEQYEYPVVADEPDSIDARDANTPDKYVGRSLRIRWIPRHPSLVRLTGKHPFNCEPPLSRLLTSGLGSGSASDSGLAAGSAAPGSRSDPASGFITPVPLHYVRNHGYVPRLDWSTWRIDISGLVSKPASLSMADLLAMPSRKLPVLLVCVGNRRKEQNAVKQTIGFSWGAGAAATTVWKGVLLRDVLIKCGVQLKGKNAGKFVCFEGAETLPGGGGSTYGTSMELWRVMDPANEVLLAYEQNGQELSPDHGFPVRVIIPGFIGGRMVKWLKKVEVTREESQNYYHFHDNRVLPSHVDAETAMKDGWWRKKEYICNELAINSAIVSPDHGDVVALEGGAGRQVVTMKGYAYSGGGRRVTRVEITLDGGSTWRLCDITHPSPPTRHGKHWTWSLWATEVPVIDLVGASEVAVRAWDDATNTQPDKLTWNVMGMMNNCWFRVRVAPTVTPEGSIGLQFIHPTRPGNLPGGWMYDAPGDGKPGGNMAAAGAGGSTAAVLKAADLPAAAAAAGASQTKPGPAPAPAASAAVAGSGERSGAAVRKISMAEIERHADESSPWIVVHGRVYDCTKFLKDHPGGSESITINAGTDVTEEFDAIHSEKAKKMLEEYYIGDVAGEGEEEGPSAAAAVTVPAATPAPTPLPASPTALHPTTLDPKKRISVPLLSKVSLSPDVRRFRFALPSANHILGLPVGKHLFVCAKVGGKLVMRAYTPTTSDEDGVGYFDLVVKVYFKGVVPQFPDGGVMSQHLESLSVGDTIEIKGPLGHIEYLGRGKFLVSGEEKQGKKLAMLAGGTGITPIYQVAKAILADPEDKTEMWVLFGNRSVADVLLQDEMDRWVEQYPGRFHVWYTICEPVPEGWKYGIGFVTAAMANERLPRGGEDSLALMCGPPPMIRAMTPLLEGMGYSTAEPAWYHGLLLSAALLTLLLRTLKSSINLPSIHYFPPFGGMGQPLGSFEQSFHVYPVSFIDKAHLENGDKVIMPPSALDRLASLHIDYPMLFEVHNAAANRTSHCGVLEFIAEEGYVYMPYWMMQNLLLQEGDIVRFRNATLPKGTYVKLQPHTKDFLDISNPKAVLEMTLRSFSCLTKGESIMVAYNNKRYFIDVVDARPAAAISIIETDCEVDFAPPLDYVEPERVPTPVKAPAAGAAAAAAGGSEAGGKKGAGKDGKAEAAPPPEEPAFTPFVGTGRRLDGRPAASPSSPATSAAATSAASREGVSGAGGAGGARSSGGGAGSSSSGGAAGGAGVASGGRKEGRLVFGSGDGAPRAGPKGKAVLIVGGSSGIGLCIGEMAVQQGARVAIAARNKDRLASAHKQLEALLLPDTPSSDFLLSVAADAANLDDARRAIDQVVAAFGRLDVVICCQGQSTPHQFEFDTVENQQQLMNVNYWASVYVIRAALPAVKRAGKDGRIMLVSSQAGQVGIYGYTAYSAAKFALRGLAEALQMELEHVGTRVVMLFPPDTDTPQLQQENVTKPAVTKAITEGNKPFPPMAVARAAISAVERGDFLAPVGFDGWMLSIATAGMSPCVSLNKLLLELLLAGPMRLVAAATVAGFNASARRWHRINHGRGT
ncbi:unnamed protein product, partial [Closterium sp. NIES-64]